MDNYLIYTDAACDMPAHVFKDYDVRTIPMDYILNGETLSFDEAYSQVKTKYDRRIARLYDNVNNAKRTLFVWCDPARPLSKDDRASAESRLRAAFPGKDVRLLSVSSEARLQKRCTGAPSGCASLSAA